MLALRRTGRWSADFRFRFMGADGDVARPYWVTGGDRRTWQAIVRTMDGDGADDEQEKEGTAEDAW